MKSFYDKILIIADLEGSSGCWNRKASAFKTNEWAHACVDMSLDVNSIVSALFQAGVKNIRIKDFHRTGYNLIPELIDPRACILSGYKTAPIPAIGDPGDAEGLMMIGMHASSGSKGFISHTLTSRIKSIECNGAPLSEAELLSMAAAPYGIRPLLFSGGPIACEEVHSIMDHIITYPIDKSPGPDGFSKTDWRRGLQKAAIKALDNKQSIPYIRQGPFTTIVTMRDGKKAAKVIAGRWHCESKEDKVIIKSPTPKNLFYTLLKITYLTPFIEAILPFGLILFNLYGKTGHWWLYSRLKKNGVHIKKMGKD